MRWIVLILAAGCATGQVAEMDRRQAEAETAQQMAQTDDAERTCAAANPGDAVWPVCLRWNEAKSDAREERAAAARARRGETVQEVVRALQAPYQQQASAPAMRQPTSCTSYVNGNNVQTNCY